jgi:hypothetical protein
MWHVSASPKSMMPAATHAFQVSTDACHACHFCQYESDDWSFCLEERWSRYSSLNRIPGHYQMRMIIQDQSLKTCLLGFHEGVALLPRPITDCQLISCDAGTLVHHEKGNWHVMLNTPYLGCSDFAIGKSAMLIELCKLSFVAWHMTYHHHDIPIYSVSLHQLTFATAVA